MTATYKMVRLAAATHARLAALRDTLFRAYQEGRLDLPDNQAEHLSLDFVVNRLLDDYFDHKRRVEAAKTNSRRRHQAAGEAVVNERVYMGRV